MLGEGGLVLWFGLVALSTAFVAVDIRRTPAHPVLKWAFVILAVFTGPFAAFFYVLGCREPFKDTHALFVATRWRQVLGSTMHCAAGDGIGIIAGAALVAFLHPAGWVELPLEYLLGFGFGWTFFQAFAQRGCRLTKAEQRWEVRRQGSRKQGWRFSRLQLSRSASC